MSTSDQNGDQPLTRRQLRELRLTGSTPIIAPEEAAAAKAQQEERDAAPVPAPAPVPDIAVDLHATPLTRRQAREQERIRTATVPVILPENTTVADETTPEAEGEIDTAPEEEAPSAPETAAEPSAEEDGAVGDADLVEGAEASAEEAESPVNGERDDEDQPDDGDGADGAEASSESDEDADDDDVEELVEIAPVSAASAISGTGGIDLVEADEVAIDQDEAAIAIEEAASGDDVPAEEDAPVVEDAVDASEDVAASEAAAEQEATAVPASETVAEEDRPVIDSSFGDGVLHSSTTELPTFEPSFDELITADSAGASGVAPSTLIFTPSPGEGSLSGPVASTGEILVTGSYELPKGIGSQGHAEGTTDGKEVDSVLIDGELPPASSPTPIAASAAVSTIKPAGEVIRPPAPEKGNKLMLALAITAGGLALVLAAALIVAFATNVFG